MKTHAAWIFTAAILAFSLEGFMGTAGENLAHTLGMDKGLLGVLGATVIGYIYSVLYEPRASPPPKARKRPVK